MKGKVVLILILFVLSGCNLNNNPTSKVEELLSNYQGLNKTNFEKLQKRMLDGTIKGRNKRTVWSLASSSYHGAHFATYPFKLIESPIKAGCPEGGIVLDPFIGSGTTAVVAEKLNRNWLGIELNPEYVKLAEKRINENRCGK